MKTATPGSCEPPLGTLAFGEGMIATRTLSSTVALAALISSAGLVASCVAVPVCETHPDVCVKDDREKVIANCAEIPLAAVGAEYAFELDEIVSGIYGTHGEWMVSALPPGLRLDPETRTISGVPTEPGVFDLELTVTNFETDDVATFSCGEIDVQERLSALDVRFETNHCIPHSASRDEMLARLTGGDGSEIRCLPLEDSDSVCAYGDGNGRPPPGISFDAETCTHTGEISGSRRGTWVWMVEVEQGGYVTSVPFCATRDIDTYHEIGIWKAGGDWPADEGSDLAPGLLEYSPDSDPIFGEGEYVWVIEDPGCEDTPSACTYYATRNDVSCSPFDKPFDIQVTKTSRGLEHDLTATGPVPSAAFRHRPWVGSFHFEYATSGDEINEDNFATVAQTKYHFDVVAFPVESGARPAAVPLGK